MTRSWSLLLWGALAASLTACGSGTNNTPDSGVPADNGTPPADVPAGDTGMPPADGGGGACYTEMGAAGLCPMRRITPANPMQPYFRLTHITVTAPAALASPLVLGTVNDAIHNGRFLWGLKLDLAANTYVTGALNPMATMRGSVGLGLLDGTFSFYMNNAPAAGGMPNRWDPAMGMTTAMGDRVSISMPRSIRLPVFNEDGSISVELPLRNASIRNVAVPMDRGCIGLGLPRAGVYNECRSDWETASMGTAVAELEACVTVADAQGVNVAALGRDLCTLLAGPPAGMTCANAPMAMWTRQPDMPNCDGMPGYTLRAQFAAVSANIR